MWAHTSPLIALLVTQLTGKWQPWEKWNPTHSQNHADDLSGEDLVISPDEMKRMFKNVNGKKG